MKILHRYPPNIEKIREVFTLHSGIIFTYGDTIFNPDKGLIDEALLAHESTHSRQQGKDPEAWWNRYLTDTKFRTEQELEAYRNQYKYAVEHYTRQMRKQLLKTISKDLASAMYGNIMTREEAREAIQKI